MSTAPDAAFRAMGRESFVSLGTFRRSGAAVATPVWLVADGDDLLVYTQAGSGKVKRLRHDDRVTLQPCSRRGVVAEGAPTVPGRATIVTDAAEIDGYRPLFRAKYGWQYRVFLLIERLTARRRPNRAVLRIVPA